MKLLLVSSHRVSPGLIPGPDMSVSGGLVEDGDDLSIILKNKLLFAVSVVDPDPESVGSETFFRIRIGVGSGINHFESRIRAALNRNEFETKHL
jgi:hypothetical protein